MDDKELLRDDLRMDAYYYAFSETGQILVDRMLSSVALAGKAYHHTEFWSDDAEPWRSWQRGSSHVEFIQNAANDVATRLTALAEENERLAAEVARLRGALESARDALKDWGSYAGEYFQQKHGLANDIAAIDAALAPSARTPTVFDEIQAERARQDAKWGQQDHPSIPPILADRHPTRWCEEYEIPTEERAKFMCQTAAKRGECTFTHIAVEELSEAVECKDDAERRGELVQLAAVIVQWIQAIDRRAPAARKESDRG